MKKDIQLVWVDNGRIRIDKTIPVDRRDEIIAAILESVSEINNLFIDVFEIEESERETLRNHCAGIWSM